MEALNTLNTNLITLDTESLIIANKKANIINEAIKIVEDKITSIVDNKDYNATEKKAIKVIKDAMFTTAEIDGKIVKLHQKLKSVIKLVVISKKRSVFDFILWDEISLTTIENILKHLTINEIKTATSTEDFKALLDSKKTRVTESKTFEKTEKK